MLQRIQDPQRQPRIKHGKAQGIGKTLCVGPAALSFIFTFLLQTSSVCGAVPRCTCTQSLAGSSSAPISKPQRRTDLPSLDLRSLSGPVSHDGRGVCALRGGMGGPPLTLWLAQKIPKKGVVCIEGTKAVSSPPHIPLTCCCVFMH